MKKLLNVEYSTIQGAYWMYYGVVASFASVFLLEQGYTNANIGMILAIGSIVAVFLQPFAADIADNSKRSSLIGITIAMTAVLAIATLGLFLFNGQSMALSAVFVFLVGWHTAIQPLINSLSFKLQESGYKINFGVARSVGSLAYAILCGILGWVVTKFGIIAIPVAGEAVLISMLVLLLLVKAHFKKASAQPDELKDIASVKEGAGKRMKANTTLKEFVARNKLFIIVNVGVVGLFFSNSALNNFMFQIVTNVGGDSADMGTLFSIMAALEIPTMIVFDRIRARWSCQTLLKVAAIFFAIKIALCLVATSVTMLVIAMLTQLISFALFLPAMVHFINEIMDRGEAVKGQAVYTIMTTVGAVLASLIGGLVLDISGAKMLLLVSTVFTVAGAAIIVATVDKISSHKEY